MATPAADFCNIGVGAGKSNYQLDYSTATGAGITTATPATMASSTGISNIMYADASNSMQMLRSDVDVDVIAANGYPRSEYRERQQDGTTLRAFNPTTGDHWVECWIFPTHLPPNFKPSFVMLQMHDNSDDVLEIAWQPAASFGTDGKQEIVLRINGTSSGVPTKFSFDAKLNMWYRCRIHVGTIGFECTVNSVTMRSTDASMPTMVASGANSYFKCGMYLQTKWTGSGTGGLETDRNEYGEAGYRDFRTSHNGETDTSVQVRGTFTPNQISNVRWGTKAEIQNTAGDNVTPITLSPALPASLVDGDMMYLIVRARRTATVIPSTSVPSSPAIATGWVRLIGTHSTTTGTSTLVAHNIRFSVWFRRWVTGDAAPSITYLSGTTADLMNAQIFAIHDSKISTLGSVSNIPLAFSQLIDQPPNGLDVSSPADNTVTVTGITYAAAASTTVVGPTAALPANAAAGSLAIAAVAHEINLASGAVGTVTGGSDGLTWAEGGEGVLATVAGHAWGNDWALIPATAGQAVPAKQAAATLAADADPVTAGSQSGKGWGVLFTLAAANRHRRAHRAAF